MRRWLTICVLLCSSIPAFAQPADGEAKGFLGVKMRSLADGIGSGVLVTEIVVGSPAEKAGIKVGDVILKVANVEAKDHDVVRETIGQFRPGDRIAIELTRSEREMTVHAVLAERPKDQ